jgi:putative restriction endonuclease
MMNFEIGEQYTRAQVQDALGVPEDRRGGDWATGYTTFNDQIYVFCTVGAAGRTGHDYPNRWEGDDLVWSAKSHSKIGQPLMQAITSGSTPVNIFHRSGDRASFTYAGVGTPVEVTPTTPVVVRWSFTSSPIRRLSGEAICNELSALGFELGVSGRRMRRAIRAGTTVYVKLESETWVLVVHPKFEEGISYLKSFGGVYRPANRFFYHSSAMAQFPKRLQRGKRPTHYGIDFDFTSLAALKMFVAMLDKLPNFSPEIVTVPDSMDGDPRTETEAMRAVRLGQQKFRNDLLDRWGGRCALTGLAIPGLLRASHIKPWCDSEPTERHDPDNGLLLAVHIDGLFDRGFISFDEGGRIMLSSELSEADLKCFAISSDSKINRLRPEHQKYLVHHRAKFDFIAAAKLE